MYTLMSKRSISFKSHSGPLRDGVRCDDKSDSTGQRNCQHMSAKGSGEGQGSLLRLIGLQDVRCITGEKCMNSRGM
jgi:hypothetical protein